MQELCMEIITYGLGKKFDSNKFLAVENVNYHPKPIGGLWGSPIHSSYGWKEFGEVGRVDTSFVLKISGNILVIDSIDDLKFMEWREESRSKSWYPDYIKMKTNLVDAIYLTRKGEIETRSIFQEKNLNGWDCECVFIMNPLIIRSDEVS